jgi:hypothetical protein
MSTDVGPEIFKRGGICDQLLDVVRDNYGTTASDVGVMALTAMAAGCGIQCGYSEEQLVVLLRESYQSIKGKHSKEFVVLPTPAKSLS